MGHDIYGYNKDGRQIAYARFSYINLNATLLYSLLNAQDYYGGVSGTGESSIYSRHELEESLKDYYRVLAKKDDKSPEDDMLTLDKEQIKEFIDNCLTTAKREGSVEVFFG